MRALPILLLLLAGCGETTQSEAPPADRSAGISGLYEGGTAGRPNRLCIVESAGQARFGLFVAGDNEHNCTGSGAAVREGAMLKLTMKGDPSCVIQASIDGESLTVPDTLPQGCAYYCGADARLGGASFERKGDTPEEAAQATDLVGEPLCSRTN